VPAYGPQNDVTLKMPAFEWVHVQLHQQKGMISLSPPTICNSAFFSKYIFNYCSIGKRQLILPVTINKVFIFDSSKAGNGNLSLST
ncbi:hypothetical protein ACUX20_24530, partial [Salmonella enterica]